MELHQIKRLLYSKGNNRVKRQSTEWEKILANYSFNKRIISRIKNSNRSIAKYTHNRPLPNMIKNGK
jgi:hypothetical protein